MGLSIWLACVLAYLMAQAARRWPSWVRGVYFLALSFCLMALAHYLIDQLQIWYVTPLGPPLKLVR